jgi:hypothetical protein
LLSLLGLLGLLILLLTLWPWLLLETRLRLQGRQRSPGLLHG